MGTVYSVYLGPYLEYWTKTEKVVQKNCLHTFESKFCPQCGKKKGERVNKTEIGRLFIPDIFDGEEPFADVVEDRVVVDGKNIICLIPNHSRNPPRQMHFDMLDFDSVNEYASADLRVTKLSIAAEIGWFREQFGKDIETIDSHLKGQMSIIKWGLVLHAG